MRPLLATLGDSQSYVTGKVLDVGCGRQPYRGLFPGIKQYVGLDFDLEGSQPDVSGTSVQLPFRDEGFDTVLCTQVLEHVPDPFATVSEVARVLKPGGHLVLTAPQAWRLHEYPHDYYRFTRFGLAYMLRRHGLEPVRIVAQGGVWALVGQTILNTLPHRHLFYMTAPLNLIVNSVFLVLDFIWHDTRDTLNHLVIARKS